MAAMIATVALGAPLFVGGVIYWVDVLERAFAGWHEDQELAGGR